MKRSTRPTVYEVNPSELAPADMGVVQFPEDMSESPLWEFASLPQWGLPRARLIEGSFTPFIANDLALRLFSSDVRNLIDALRLPDDDVEWLPVEITRGSLRRKYWVLSFTVDVKPLHPKRTVWIGDTFPKIPIIRVGVAEKRSVFAWTNHGYSFFASSGIADALRRQFPQWISAEMVRTG